MIIATNHIVYLRYTIEGNKKNASLSSKITTLNFT